MAEPTPLPSRVAGTVLFVAAAICVAVYAVGATLDAQSSVALSTRVGIAFAITYAFILPGLALSMAVDAVLLVVRRRFVTRGERGVLIALAAASAVAVGAALIEAAGFWPMFFLALVSWLPLIGLAITVIAMATARAGRPVTPNAP